MGGRGEGRTAATWAVARSVLRSRAWATVALAVLATLASGVVIAAVAGARRTDSAMDRFVAFSRPEHLYVQAPDSATAEKVAGLPQVADSDRFPFIFLSRTADGTDAMPLVSFAAADERAFRTMNRNLVLHGRQARVDDPAEVMVNERAARHLRLRVGSSVTLHAYSLDQVQSSAATGGLVNTSPAGPAFAFRVVGVVRAPADVNPGADSDVVSYLGRDVLVMTPAFLRAYAAGLGTRPDDLPGMEGVRIRLRHGLADLDAFRTAALPVIGDRGQVLGGSDADSAAAAVSRATHFQAVALLAFAGVAALAALLIVGQALARQVAVDAADHGTLRALGMTTTELSATALCRPALVALAAAALAPGVAVGLSPLFPDGLARQAELHPGVAVDLPVLAVGAAAVLALVLLRSGLTAWRLARSTRAAAATGAPPRRGSRVVDAIARAGLPAPASTGVRLSLESGPGGAAVSVRGAMVATTTAVVGVVAALIFGVSLGALARNPRQQGWNWDVVVGNPNSGDVAGRDIPLLEANPAVGAFAGLVFVEGLHLAGHQVEAVDIDARRGEVFPTVLDGREPRQADEILLGSATLREIGHSVGDTVEAEVGDRRMTVRVVGRAVTAPPPGTPGTAMNKGAVMTGAAARQLFPDAAPPKLFVVRYTPGADRAAAFASLERDFPGLVVGFGTADEIRNLQRVDGLAFLLAALLVVLGGGVTAHALVTTTRRRRRDLAVLKTLGFVRRQVTATVAWQATTLAVIGLLLGLPLGVAAGHWSWTFVVGQMGSRSNAVVPILNIAEVLVLILALVNLLAGWPGWKAANLRPATVLRTE